MKKIKILFIIAFAFLLIPSAEAISFNDLSESGDNIKIKKDINGTSFIAGNNVDVSNKTDGISFIAGNSLNLSHESDYIFAAGNLINLQNTKFKDGFIAGNTINIDSNEIQRDLYVAGNTITIKGKVERNLFVGSSKVVIDGVIDGDVYLSSENIRISSSTRINGTLKYNEKANIKIDDKAYVKAQKEYKQVSNKANFASRVLDIFGLYSNLLIFGIALLFLFKKVFKKLEEKELTFENVVKNFGVGILILITVPIISLILISTMIGISIGIVLIGLYILIIYLSNIFSVYYIFNGILSKKVSNKYTILIVGLAITYALRLVPFVGNIIQMIMLFTGIGIIYELISNLIKSNK